MLLKAGESQSKTEQLCPLGVRTAQPCRMILSPQEYTRHTQPLKCPSFNIKVSLLLIKRCQTSQAGKQSPPFLHGFETGQVATDTPALFHQNTTVLSGQIAP